MLSSIVSILYFFAYFAAGQAAAMRLFSTERPLVRIWLGGVAALLMLLWLPALFAFAFGFALLAQLLALLLAIIIGAACCYKLPYSSIQRFSFRPERAVLLLFLPLFLLGAYLFITHTILPVNGALHVGQSTFGDLALHLGFVTSIGEQGFFPPDYSIFPGAAVGYPFLCDSISATFYVLGAPLQLAMLLPAVFAYALVLLGVYFFFERWLGNRRTAIFAALLFFIGGGFGFAYFFDQAQTYPHQFAGIFTEFYQTPTNYVTSGMKWVNPIADMLIPQRATLFGWVLLFPALYMLRRAAYEGERRWFVPLGILGGLMPLVHTHSFLALGIISAVYLLQAILQRRDFSLSWVWYGLIAIGIAAPQLLLFTFRQSSGFLQLHFNWANETDSFLWFYIKNWGLLFLLLPIAYYRLERRERSFFLGPVAIWLLVECIQFQPNPYDNNKLLFVFFAYLCGIIAKLLLDWYAQLKNFQGRRYVAALTIVVCFLSGVLTLGREAVSDYELFYTDEVQAAAFIQENTAPDAVFLTATNHNNAVAALTGRNILCGTGSYLYYHGLDYMEREQLVRLMFEEPAQYIPQYAAQYGVEYVFLSYTERSNYWVDETYFSQFPVLFDTGSIQIFDIRKAWM